MTRPRPEWRHDANRIPHGRVREVVPWGDCGAVYVGDDHRAFAAQVFEIDDSDANADFAGSLDDCYAAVRDRVTAGGEGWKPR